MAKSFDGSFDQREQIRDAIDIVDLVERYVPLRRQGANFVGRCPWHDDSRPSLQVNAQRQTFKCWVCNIGGDIFSFVMRIENVEFKEALHILADMAGIELVAPKKNFRKRLPAPAPTEYLPPVDEPPLDEFTQIDLPDDAYPPHGDVEFVGDPSAPGAPSASAQFSSAPRFVPVEITKAVLYRALEWLATKYRETFLNAPEAEEARRYVRERGIDEASSEKYQIGYSPLEFDATLRWIGFDRNRVRTLEEAGVLAYREEYDDRGRAKPRPRFALTPQLGAEERRRYYDRFRGRLMFPIRDVQDRVVAFGGRLLPNTTLKSPAKYVNSPETPVFVKSKMVYGLDRARNAIRKSSKVLITEGYTDCIVTAQFGFENVVAVLGTALGAEHVRMLKRFADKMILLLDGDEAGQKRTREVLRFFVEQGVDMSVLTLPDNDDPCEFLLEKGPEAFAELLEHNTVDAIDHAFRAATAGVDLEGDVVGSAKALDSLLEIVALAPDAQRSLNDPVRLRTIKTIQRLSTRFRVSEDEIRRQLAEKRARSRSYADRSEEREERYEQRRLEREQNEAREFEADAEPRSPEELEAEAIQAQIAAFRRDWVYPVPGEDEESDEELRERFVPFERFVLNDARLRPSVLEREYLETWLVAPNLYPTFVAKIANESFRSPVTRQLDLLARDFFERGLEPTFERVMLRYEDDSMKSFLIELDDGAIAKGLRATLESSESRDFLLREIIAGFERAKVERAETKHLTALRENASPEDKMKTLLELQRQQWNKQQNRVTRENFESNAEIDDSE